MTFLDNFNTNLRGGLLAALGEPVTVTPVSGSPSTVTGLFDNQYLGVDGEGAIVASRKPTFCCAAADVTGIVVGDALTYNSTSYTIRGIQPDGHGEVLLILTEDD